MLSSNDTLTRARHGLHCVTEGARPVFRLRGVGKTYLMGEVRVEALAEVGLDLAESEFVVLPGASGSGKSTLLNILGGLDTPTTGTLTCFGHDLTQTDDAPLTRLRREHVGFVFQFNNLISSLTALENVTLVTGISDDPAGAPDFGAGKLALQILDRACGWRRPGSEQDIQIRSDSWT